MLRIIFPNSSIFVKVPGLQSTIFIDNIIRANFELPYYSLKFSRPLNLRAVPDTNINQNFMIFQGARKSEGRELICSARKSKGSEPKF